MEDLWNNLQIESGISPEYLESKLDFVISMPRHYLKSGTNHQTDKVKRFPKTQTSTHPRLKKKLFGIDNSKRAEKMRYKPRPSKMPPMRRITVQAVCPVKPKPAMSFAHKNHPSFKKWNAIRELGNKGILEDKEVYQLIKVLLMGDDLLHVPSAAAQPSASAFSKVSKRVEEKSEVPLNYWGESSNMVETCSSPSVDGKEDMNELLKHL